MTELQKHSKTATKEQMRLAELIQGRELGSTNDDVTAQKRVKKIIELTNCTPSVAEVALIDCEGSVEAAVALLLDKPDEIVLWSQQSGKTRKSKSTTTPATNGSSSKPFNQSRRRVDDGLPSNKPFNQSRRKADDELPSNKPFNQSRRKADDELPSNKPFNQSRRRVDDELPSNKPFSQSRRKADDELPSNKPFSQSRRKEDDEWASNKPFSQSRRKEDDEWKAGQRVYMPSSVTTNSANVVGNSAPPANATPSWPSLDNNSSVAPTSALADLPQIQQNKLKTFASVAATKKAPPPPPPQPVKALSSTSINEGSSSSTKPVDKTADVAKGAGDGDVTEWSSSVDWGTAALSPPPAEPSPARQTTLEQQAVATSEVFGSSGHSLNVNQKYTDDLKSVIGLGSAGKSPINQSAPNPVVSLSSMDTFQQQISQFTKPSMAAPTTTTELGKKVEFATGDFPPPVADASAYQFGFQFKDGGIPSAASLNDAWTNKPHISTVELDRSMLKDAAVNVLSTMTNIPTTSSNVTAHAHFSTSAQQQAAHSQHDFQRNSSSRSAALSFTDTASVNYPPANNASGMTMNGGTAVVNLPPQQQQNAGIPSTAQQQPQPQQQQNKPVYTASNQSMVVNAQQQHLQHLQQQQSQALYHQTSAAAAPTAVPQFPGYNMPYPMYSPAPAMPGQNAELERFFMQPQYAPYGGLEVQLNSMSLGPPTTLAPSHRNPMETFMDNKFAPNQQQQSVNQGNAAAALQHGQSGQQHRAQNETNAIFGGTGQVAPPPGFSMPTAAVQPSFMPQANLQSLFQMPAYNPQMSYQQQYMMTNANRMPNSQRPAQTSPPEGNNGHQQRRHDSRSGPESQGYGGGGGPDSVDHSAGGAGSAAAQSYIQKFNYRQYM